MICDEIIRFSEKMQYKLDKNKHKECQIMNPDNKGRGWRNCDIMWLLNRLKEEVGELEESLILNKTVDEISCECADVGNFAMMIFDIIQP